MNGASAFLNARSKRLRLPWKDQAIDSDGYGEFHIPRDIAPTLAYVVGDNGLDYAMLKLDQENNLRVVQHSKPIVLAVLHNPALQANAETNVFDASEINTLLIATVIRAVTNPGSTLTIGLEAVEPMTGEAWNAASINQFTTPSNQDSLGSWQPNISSQWGESQIYQRLPFTQYKVVYQFDVPGSTFDVVSYVYAY